MIDLPENCVSGSVDDQTFKSKQERTTTAESFVLDMVRMC